jgi:hypothetical protein
MSFTGSPGPLGSGQTGEWCRPRALAVLRLMTSSNFVGCPIGLQPLVVARLTK